ncbi:MAG: carboxymuconolactone decarboxylase family protein [Anaerolineales bacterium]|nr:carboxymuconolactone decarboxylase family protein [Anaerolineales bacterium]
MKPFPRRTYRSLRDFWKDVSFIFANRPLVRYAFRHLISPPFQQRLMLAVTQVNNCRYCMYFHAQEALRAGVSQAELSDLLDGEFANCPPEEHIALLYAQHWAESNAHPDPEAYERLRITYGSENAQAIHIVLHMIRMGNLLGNTVDSWLYWLSLGRLGVGNKPAPRSG